MYNINLYYDIITKDGPVPNGVSGYMIDKKVWPLPFGNQQSLVYAGGPKARSFDGDSFSSYYSSCLIDSGHSLVSPICSFYDSVIKNNCDVDLLTHKNFCENLFYPLELSSGINVSISDSTIKNLRKRKLKLLLLGQTVHGYVEMCRIKSIAEMFANVGVPSDNIFIVIGDVNNCYKELFKPFKSYSIDWWQIESKLIITNSTDKYKNFLQTEDPILPVTDYNIKNFNPKLLFHTYSSSNSWHRSNLIKTLKDNNLYNKGTVISKDDNIDYHANSIFTIITPPFSPHKEPKYMSEVNALFTNLELWQLIAMGKPFIVIGCQQTIKYLNQQGYFTFYDLINEKYDSYLDTNIRIELVCKELARVYDNDNSDKLKIIKKAGEINRSKFLSRSHMPNFLNLFDEMRYG